jgi:hypothetical protein
MGRRFANFLFGFLAYEKVSWRDRYIHPMALSVAISQTQIRASPTIPNLIASDLNVPTT